MTDRVTTRTTPRSQALPTGFRRTEVGVIPADWHGLRLSDVERCLDGRRRLVKETARIRMPGPLPETNTRKTTLGQLETELDAKAYARYPKLTEEDVKGLVVEDKWLATLDARVHGEMDRVSQQLTARVKELAQRYEATLPQLTSQVEELEHKVNEHLKRMGFSWN